MKQLLSYLKKSILTLLFLSIAFQIHLEEAYACASNETQQSDGSCIKNTEAMLNQVSNQQISVGMLPGYDGDLSAFFNKIIRTSVGISFTLAILMLVLAGFAAVQAKDSAKEEYFTKIKNVSTGLALILLSYLIMAGLYSLLFAI